MLAEVAERLREHGDVVELSDSSPTALIEAVTEADALVVRSRAHITARVINAAPKLRVIGRAGSSLDHIDMRAALRRQITVVYTPLAQVPSIADYTVTMILACARRLFWYDRKIRAGQFDTLRTPFGREIRNLTIGLLGGGAVAHEVARICRDGFRARVIVHEPECVPPQDHDATRVDLDTLLREADVLSIHMAQRPQFIKMIGERELALMKPTACVVNTSRGSIVDNQALAEALKRQHLAGAALDVFDAEPLPTAHCLRNAPNCILSPHIAAMTLDVPEEYYRVAEDVIRVLKGENPRYPAPAPKSD
ncbi:MAG: NAD(P)-dependent oxidoreductase [Phycisphaerae bacterium]